MAQPDFERARIAGTGIASVETAVNGETSGLAPRFATLPNGDVRRQRDVSRRFTPTPGAGTEVVLDPSRPKSAARELGRAISGARTVTRGGRSLPEVSGHSWSDDWSPDVLGPDIQPDSGFISQGTFDAMAEGGYDNSVHLVQDEIDLAWDEHMERDAYGRPGSEFVWALADEWAWNGYSETYEGEQEDWLSWEEEMELATEPGVYGAKTNGHAAEDITDQEASLLTEKDRRALARQRQFQGDAKRISNAQLGAVIDVSVFVDPRTAPTQILTERDVREHTTRFILEKPVRGPRPRADAWSRGRPSRSEDAREWFIGRSSKGIRSQELTGINKNWGEVIDGGHVSVESVIRHVSEDPGTVTTVEASTGTIDVYMAAKRGEVELVSF